MSTKLDIAKTVVKLAVGSGVTKIMGDIIRNNTNPAESTEEKIKVAAGSLVLGAMVADHASDYVDETVDKAVSAYTAWKNRKEDTEEK